MTADFSLCAGLPLLPSLLVVIHGPQTGRLRIGIARSCGQGGLAAGVTMAMTAWPARLLKWAGLVNPLGAHSRLRPSRAIANIAIMV